MNSWVKRITTNHHGVLASLHAAVKHDYRENVTNDKAYRRVAYVSRNARAWMLKSPTISGVEYVTNHSESLQQIVEVVEKGRTRSV